MAARKPLVLNSGSIQQIQAGDTLDAVCNEIEQIAMINGEIADAITIGMPVYVFASGTVKKARANAQPTSYVVALCKDVSVASGNSGYFQTSGQLTSADWSAVTGGSATLTAGSLYFLSSAAGGQLVTTAPVAGYIAQVGIAISTTALDLNPRQIIQL